MKLGPHIINGSADGMRFAIEGKAPVAKFVDGFSGAGALAGRVPVIIGRATIGGDDKWRHYIGSPEQYYAERLAGHVTHAANAVITHWETGVNEDHRKVPFGEATDPDDVGYRAAFEAEVARHIWRAGKLPVLGNFAVGNPSGTRDEQRAAWRAYAPALRAAEIYNGLIGLHGYYTVAGWEHVVTTLLDVLGELSLPRVRIVINEAGADMPAWKDRGLDELTYASQLRAFDAVLNRWPRVIGATLYTFGGGPEWASHRLDDSPLLLSQLIQYGRDTADSPQPAPTPNPTPIPAPAQNLIINPGFEDTPDGKGWQFFVDSTSVQGKEPTFRIERAERGASPLSRHSGNAGGQIIGQWICYQAGVAQTHDLPAGKYRLSAWGRPWMRADGRFELESEEAAVHHWLVGASSVAAGGLGYQSTSARGWARLAHEFDHAGGVVRVYIIGNVGGVENHWPYDITAFSFDDVELVRLDTDPPTPAKPRMVRVIAASGLNVRNGPSVYRLRIGYVGVNTYLPIIETDPLTGWHRITPDGWISGAAKFVEVE